MSEPAPIDRRTFLKLGGAAALSAVLAGCSPSTSTERPAQTGTGKPVSTEKVGTEKLPSVETLEATFPVAQEYRPGLHLITVRGRPEAIPKVELQPIVLNFLLNNEGLTNQGVTIFRPPEQNLTVFGLNIAEGYIAQDTSFGVNWPPLRWEKGILKFIIGNTNGCCGSKPNPLETQKALECILTTHALLHGILEAKGDPTCGEKEGGVHTHEFHQKWWELFAKYPLYGKSSSQDEIIKRGYDYFHKEIALPLALEEK
jgi:hypothetical protein